MRLRVAGRSVPKDPGLANLRAQRRAPAWPGPPDPSLWLRVTVGEGTRLITFFSIRHGGQDPVPVALQLHPQALHLRLHEANTLVHADDYLGAGQVHAQVLDQALDLAQPRDVRLRVQPLPPLRPAGPHE